ncbi:MAG: EcsC family protein [Myxococcales bacterium]|nr:EcsC family protein [Myxococcales bacterium]
MTDLALQVLDRADTQLVAGWYHAVSVSTERVRAWLRSTGLQFVDPSRDTLPTLADLDVTTERIIGQAMLGAGAVSGMAGIAGAASIPPEMLASMVSVLRLGQRLCIVYGFDPGTDRGQMALCRALAAAYDVELPAAGPVGMRVSDLPRLASPNTDPRSIGASLAKAVLVQSAFWVANRLTRLVPVISATSSAVDARNRTERAARQMQAVLERLSDLPSTPAGELEDALELQRTP